MPAQLENAACQGPPPEVLFRQPQRLLRAHDQEDFETDSLSPQGKEGRRQNPEEGTGCPTKAGESAKSTMGPGVRRTGRNAQSPGKQGTGSTLMLSGN